MQINPRLGELNIKIVYYGPPYSGKTTNLERLYATTNPQRRSQLTSMKNHEDRTLFFDFMQIEMGKIGSLTPRFNLYTVPGQVIYAVTRQIILRNADAVVFVADSAPEKLAENIWSWQQLQQQLHALGYELRTFPIIVQINKRDLPNALPIAVLRDCLQLQGRACIEAQALHDIGTRETLKATIRSVLGSN
jgi:signal recognition particle receptor subunit beta